MFFKLFMWYVTINLISLNRPINSFELMYAFLHFRTHICPYFMLGIFYESNVSTLLERILQV